MATDIKLNILYMYSTYALIVCLISHVNGSAGHGLLVNDICMEFDYTDDTFSVAVHWIKILECDESTAQFTYSPDLNVSLLASKAVSIRFQRTEATTNYSQFIVTANIASNPIHALHAYKELSYDFDESTQTIVGAANTRDWSFDEDISMDTCLNTSAAGTVIRSFDEAIYDGCEASDALKVVPHQACRWSSNRTHGVDMAIYFGFLSDCSLLVTPTSSSVMSSSTAAMDDSTESDPTIIYILGVTAALFVCAICICVVFLCVIKKKFLVQSEPSPKNLQVQQKNSATELQSKHFKAQQRRTTEENGGVVNIKVEKKKQRRPDDGPLQIHDFQQDDDVVTIVSHKSDQSRHSLKSDQSRHSQRSHQSQNSGRSQFSQQAQQQQNLSPWMRAAAPPQLQGGLPPIQMRPQMQNHPVSFSKASLHSQSRHSPVVPMPSPQINVQSLYSVHSVGGMIHGANIQLSHQGEADIELPLEEEGDSDTDELFEQHPEVLTPEQTPDAPTPVSSPPPRPAHGFRRAQAH